MTVTSDGRSFVFGVFSADGCECENLEGVFEDEVSAATFRDEISKDPYLYGKPELLCIKQIEIGKRIDPLANIEVGQVSHD